MTPQPAAAHLPLDPAVTAETLATIFGAQRPDRDRTSAPLDPQHEAGALIAALHPRDPLEAAYATRAAAAHYGSIECFRRALLPDVPDEAAIRWHGKAVALSRMNTDMVRLLTERQAATPRGQSQPAGRPATSPLAALEEAMRRATARAAKPAGERDPMPSERPALTPSAPASTPQPEAAQAAKPACRQAAVSSERPSAAPAARSSGRSLRLPSRGSRSASETLCPVSARRPCRPLASLRPSKLPRRSCRLRRPAKACVPSCSVPPLMRLPCLPRQTCGGNSMSGEGQGPLRNGNPRGDPHASPRCGAKTRAGCSCRQPAMPNGRCRLHGGRSTGPRTEAGRAALAAANTKHGCYGASSACFWLRSMSCCAARRARRRAAPVGRPRGDERGAGKRDRVMEKCRAAVILILRAGVAQSSWPSLTRPAARRGRGKWPG